MIIVQICFVMFLAAFVRSTIGFGDSVLAMSMLPLFLNIHIATPLTALVALTIGTGILLRNWRKVEYHAVWRLILSSVVGIPIGLVAVKSLPNDTVKTILGVLIVLFATYSLTRSKGPELKHPAWSYIAGWIAGVLGGAYNTNGPPIVIYASLCRWPPERFVATMQGYFLPTGIFIVIGQAWAGMWSNQLFVYYLWSTPFVILAIVAGSLLQKLIKPGVFDDAVFVFLLIMGTILALK